MAIHLIQRSQAYVSCRQTAAATDTIVLLGEGVVAVLNAATDCVASETDIRERGLQNQVPKGVTLISDAQLVALCAEHSPVVSWNRP